MTALTVEIQAEPIQDQIAALLEEDCLLMADMAWARQRTKPEQVLSLSDIGVLRLSLLLESRVGNGIDEPNYESRPLKPSVARPDFSMKFNRPGSRWGWEILAQPSGDHLLLQANTNAKNRTRVFFGLRGRQWASCSRNQELTNAMVCKGHEMASNPCLTGRLRL